MNDWGKGKYMYATGSIKQQGEGGGSWMEGFGVKALILASKLNPASRNGILGNLLICAQWVAKDPSFLHADSDEDWAHSHFVCFVMSRLIFINI